MNNKKCVQCGFTNWADAGTCKKCGASLDESAPSNPGSYARKPLPPPVRKPSGFQILKNDMVGFLALIAPSIMWAIYIAVTVFGVSFTNKRSGTVLKNGDGGAPLLIASLIVTLGCAALLAWRLSSISKLFETGERVVGKIVDVSFFKDRGRIEFSYSYQRQSFQNGSAIMKTAKTQSYRSGDDVVLLVDPTNPNTVLIEDLYI
jgi:hypothetical protein